MAWGEEREQWPQFYVLFMDLLLKLKELEELVHALPEVFHQ